MGDNDFCRQLVFGDVAELLRSGGVFEKVGYALPFAHAVAAARAIPPPPDYQILGRLWSGFAATWALLLLLALLFFAGINGAFVEEYSFLPFNLF